jgi:(4S)-4-hydroxy-5-phosphonooxypentane-2,3-dione isomerase
MAQRATKVIVEGYILIPESEMEAITSELPNHIELTKKERGCLVFLVEQDHETYGKFNVYEEFISKEAFAEHQERVNESYWGSITKNVKRVYSIKRG